MRNTDFQKALANLAEAKSLGPPLTREPSDEEKRQRWEKQKSRLKRETESRK
jgi:hypothetical protein